MKYDYYHSGTYVNWKSMKQRCTDVNCKQYKRYANDGITLDKSWNKYENFLADMGERPEDKPYLLRKNSKKGFYKDNCYWGRKQKRNVNKYDYKGEMLTIEEIAKRTGKSKMLVYSRIKNGLFDFRLKTEIPIDDNKYEYSGDRRKDIAMLRDNGESLAKIGRKYRLSRQRIHQILNEQ